MNDVLVCYLNGAWAMRRSGVVEWMESISKATTVLDAKPILYPIGDIVKSVLSDGKKIVPVEQLMPFMFKEETSYRRYNVFDKISMLYAVQIDDMVVGYDAKTMSFISTKEIDGVTMCISVKNQLQMFLKLIELRIDVFGLIDGGDAVSVHSLKENPYYGEKEKNRRA